MTLTTFHEQLETAVRKKLKVRINDNRSTVLSVKWERSGTKVSLHRMFLDAPEEVMQQLGCYLRRDKKKMPIQVKAFINEGLQKLDYSDRLDKQLLATRGLVHDLRKIYDQVNQEYFGGKISLFITWYGVHSQRNRSRVTFGLYHEQLKLIKIHRILDQSSCPEYVVSFIVYHEMLHHVCPPYVDENGTNRVHNKDFKQQEKLFEHYKAAEKWIKQNRKVFFL